MCCSGLFIRLNKVSVSLSFLSFLHLFLSGFKGTQNICDVIYCRPRKGKNSNRFQLVDSSIASLFTPRCQDDISVKFSDLKMKYTNFCLSFSKKKSSCCLKQFQMKKSSEFCLWSFVKFLGVVYKWRHGHRKEGYHRTRDNSTEALVLIS